MSEKLIYLIKLIRSGPNQSAKILRPIWIIILLGIGLFIEPVYAFVPDASVLNLSPTDAQKKLGHYLYLLEDQNNTFTFSEIQTPSFQNKFIPTSSESVNFGITHSSYWLRLQLDVGNNPQLFPHDWLFEIRFSDLFEADFYLPQSNGVYLKKSTGTNTPSDQREIHDRHHQVLISPFLSGVQTYYVHVTPRGPMIVDADLLTMQAKVERDRVENRLLGLVYGILCAMILYNTFLFISVRDVVYLYYVLYIISAAAALLSLDGLMYDFLSPFVHWWTTNTVYFSLCITVILGNHFAYHFLNVNKRSKFVRYAVRGIEVFGVAGIFIGLITDHYTSTLFATFLSMLTSPVLLGTAIASYRAGERVAKFFLIAWSVLLLGVFIGALRYAGVLQNSFFSIYAPHVGAVIEVILLSLALGDRINSIRQEKIRVEREAASILQETNTKLEKSLRIKDNFLLAVSHELRTPMNGIIGAADLLNMQIEEDARHEHIGTLFRSANQMMSMLEKILDFSEAEASDFVALQRPFNLREMFDELAQQYANKINRKGLHFETYFDESLANIYLGDSRLLQKVLTQLLANALKFTNNGSIYFNAKKLENSSELPEQHYIEFNVIDNGCGIANEVRDEIFEAFHQIDGSFTRKQGGLGIGLSLAKNLAMKLEGELSLVTASTQGAHFRFLLRLVLDKKLAVKENNQAKQASTFAPRTLQSKGDKEVLIVEDNPINQKVLDKLVQGWGCKTFLAENGLAALDILEKNKFDLVLMDCQMPIMDGFEATRRIRQLSNGNQCVPIIAVTANAMSIDELRCYEAGMNEFIPKPINKQIVDRCLTKWFLDASAE